VGALIIAAGLISGSEKARVIDLGVGALFAAISAGFVWSARRGRKTGAA